MCAGPSATAAGAQPVCCCRQLSISARISARWQLRPNTRFLLRLLLLGQRLWEEHRSRGGKVLSCYRKVRWRDINRALNELNYSCHATFCQFISIVRTSSFCKHLHTSEQSNLSASLTCWQSLQHSGSIRQSSRATRFTNLTVFKDPRMKGKGVPYDS